MSLYVPHYPEQINHFSVIENTTRICHVQSTIKQRTTPTYISWSFPPSEFIKINTDDNFMSNSGLAGFGGIAREDKGRWLDGFCSRLGIKATLSLTSELWAIHDGLNIAKNYNLKKVIIETDSSEALMLLTVEDTVESHPDHVLIKECRYLMDELEICLIHTLRQDNNLRRLLGKVRKKSKPRLGGITSSATFNASIDSWGHGSRRIC